MIGGAVTLFIAAGVLVILGISFVYDISKNVGPAFEAATVGPRGRRYTFLRIEGRGIAIFVTFLTFLLAAGAAAGGIVLLVI